MEDAPNPNPVIISGSPVRIYATATPRSPKPTTVIPITAPPEKATFKACVIPPVIAALAVLTFAFVATFIPK